MPNFIDLKNKLTTELAAGKLSGQLLYSFLEGRVICEAIERDFDWSVLKGVTKTIKLDRHKGMIPSLNEFRYRTESGRLFSNLATIALSGKPEIFLPKRTADIAVAKQLLVQADRDVLKFAIENCSGEAQLFILQCILSDEVDEELQNFAVKTFFTNLNGAEVRPRTLNAVLPRASSEQRELGFRIAFAHVELYATLIVWNSSFREWFLERITQGDVPDYTNSSDLFRALNLLGEDGARIVEALLAQLVDNPKAQRALMVRTLHQAPSLTRHIFSDRQIRLDDFLDLILSPSFFEITEDDQAAILALCCSRGKSALQLAYESEKLPSDFLDWLATQGALTRSIGQNAPELLTQRPMPRPGLHMGSTRRPSKATKLLAWIDRAGKREVFSDAVATLPDQPRYSLDLNLVDGSDPPTSADFKGRGRLSAVPLENYSSGLKSEDLADGRRGVSMVPSDSKKQELEKPGIAPWPENPVEGEIIASLPVLFVSTAPKYRNREDSTLFTRISFKYKYTRAPTYRIFVDKKEYWAKNPKNMKSDPLAARQLQLADLRKRIRNNPHFLSGFNEIAAERLLCKLFLRALLQKAFAEEPTVLEFLMKNFTYFEKYGLKYGMERIIKKALEDEGEEKICVGDYVTFRQGGTDFCYPAALLPYKNQKPLAKRNLLDSCLYAGRQKIYIARFDGFKKGNAVFTCAASGVKYMQSHYHFCYPKKASQSSALSALERMEREEGIVLSGHQTLRIIKEVRENSSK